MPDFDNINVVNGEFNDSGISVSVAGEDFARTKITNDGVYIGTGAAAPTKRPQTIVDIAYDDTERSVNSTTWSTLNTIDLDIPGLIAGDWVELHFISFSVNPIDQMYFDFCSVNGSDAVVNSFSSSTHGAAPSGTSGFGFIGWKHIQSVVNNRAASIVAQVVAGDLVAGNLKLRCMRRAASTNAGSVLNTYAWARIIK